jgi:hypothetical protein
MRLPSVTEIIRPFSDFSHIPPDILEAACARGNAVHRLCALYSLSLWIDEVPPEYAGYFQSFQRWFDKYVLDVHLVETRVTDTALGFTGEPDLVVTIKGDVGRSLIDLKTPQVGSPSWRIQLAAYRHLVDQNVPRITRVFALRPRPDGKMPTIPPDYEYTSTVHRDFQIFLSALNCFRYFYPEK